MEITQEIQQAYRDELTILEEQAAAYVQSYMDSLRSVTPEASVAMLREAAKEAIEDALNAFGDQAGTLACDLFDSIMEREGLSARSQLYDTIDPERTDKKIRYFAGRLVEGDLPGFTKNVTDLTRFYVKRSAYDNMVRNCYQNDVRYARIPSGRETCAFCFMLSSRGFVYHSEKTARGRSLHGVHQHCDCIIVPGVEGVTKIDGYDPDLLYERWSKCAKTIGVDPTSNSEEKQKSIMKEVATRDWKWLYSDKEELSSKVDYDSEWVDYERETARLLGLNGFEVVPISRSNLYRNRRPDFVLNHIEWEMKNPENPGYMPIWNQFDKTVNGHGKHKVRNPQSERIVIGGSRSGMTLDEMERYVLKVANDEKDTFPEIKEVLLVTEEGVRRIKR